MKNTKRRKKLQRIVQKSEEKQATRDEVGESIYPMHEEWLSSVETNQS